MFLKLNFTTAQTPNIFFDLVYYIVANSSTWSTSTAATTGVTNAVNCKNYITNSSNVPPVAASSALLSAISTFDATNSEIINQLSENMPTVYYYTGNADATAATLTFRSLINDATSRISYTQFGTINFQHSSEITGSFTAGRSTTTALSLAGNVTTAQQWNINATTTSFCYWIYISPTCITWAAARPTASSIIGWNMSTQPSDWISSSTVNKQQGPYMVSQYTRLDVWNTDANSIIPVCYINGYNNSYRLFYGLSYTYDIGWGNSNSSYNFNPNATPTNHTAFSVHNTINATPIISGSYSLVSSGITVNFGTNIRNFQDHTSLATSTHSGNTANSSYIWSTPTSATTVSPYSDTYNRGTIIGTTGSDTTPSGVSAWHGIQGASVWPNSYVDPLSTQLTTGPTGPSQLTTSFYRWPGATGPTEAPTYVGSYSLQPLVWQRSDINNIGGLISDKAGVYLFNGDYVAGDEFTTGGITYSIWPLADGFSNRVGLAVPKR